MKELFLPFTKKEWLLRMLITGLVFTAVALPCKLLLSLMPNMTEIRPANAIAVILGLFWGPAAAWGIAAANMVTDMLSGYTPVVWIPGAIMNFLYAYLPYKLWYSLDFSGRGVEEPRLLSVREIRKFIVMVFLTSVYCSSMLCLMFDFMELDYYGSSWLFMFLNNFDFPVVLGIPLILLISTREDILIWTPAVEQEKDAGKRDGFLPESGTGTAIVMDIALFGLTSLGLLYYLAGFIIPGIHIPFVAEQVLLFVFMLAAILYSRRPCAAFRDHGGSFHTNAISIRAKVAIGFLLINFTAVLLVSAISYYAKAPVAPDTLSLWKYIYKCVALAANMMLFITVVFLHFVEKDITVPIEQLVKQVNDFSVRDHYAEAGHGSGTASEIRHRCG